MQRRILLPDALWAHTLLAQILRGSESTQCLQCRHLCAVRRLRRTLLLTRHLLRCLNLWLSRLLTRQLLRCLNVWLSRLLTRHLLRCLNVWLRDQLHGRLLKSLLLRKPWLHKLLRQGLV